jgi:hypothetical protein
VRPTRRPTVLRQTIHPFTMNKGTSHTTTSPDGVITTTTTWVDRNTGAVTETMALRLLPRQLGTPRPAKNRNTPKRLIIRARRSSIVRPHGTLTAVEQRTRPVQNIRAASKMITPLIAPSATTAQRRGLAQTNGATEAAGGVRAASTKITIPLSPRSSIMPTAAQRSQRPPPTRLALEPNT